MTDELNSAENHLLVTAGRVITSNADDSIQAYDAETGSLCGVTTFGLCQYFAVGG